MLPSEYHHTMLGWSFKYTSLTRGNYWVTIALFYRVDVDVEETKNAQRKQVFLRKLVW